MQMPTLFISLVLIRKGSVIKSVKNRRKAAVKIEKVSTLNPFKIKYFVCLLLGVSTTSAIKQLQGTDAVLVEGIWVPWSGTNLRLQLVSALLPWVGQSSNRRERSGLGALPAPTSKYRSAAVWRIAMKGNSAEGQTTCVCLVGWTECTSIHYCNPVGEIPERYYHFKGQMCGRGME